MRNKYFEVLVGIFILIGVLCLIFLTFKVSGSSLKSFNTQGYTIKAQFKNIGSLRKNAAVKIAGVEVGRVVNISLGQTSSGFMAVVTINITNKLRIPANYSASIATSGILGDSYISLNRPINEIMSIIGIEDKSSKKKEYLHQNSIIAINNTESAIDFRSLVSTFVTKK